MGEAKRQREILASVEQVWGVLAEFDRIAEWAPNVDHSCSLSKATEGIGAARRVQVGRPALVETIVDWEPNVRLAYRLDGLPERIGTVTNEWRLEPSGDGTTVTVTSTVEPGLRAPQQLIGRLVARKVAGESEAMLDGLAAHLEQNTSEGTTS